jgi:hypothetical protein
MLNPFKEKSEPHPIMVYVSKLENQVRQLEWQLTCHRLGSFISGIVIGIAITATIVIVKGLK